VIDITNPASPQIVGSADTPDYTVRVALSNNHAYVTVGLSGLLVLPLQCETGTPVYMMNLRAERTGSRARVQWSISQPRGHAGFRVWRETPASVRTLLGDAVPIEMDSYEFTDAAAPIGPADYWLQEMTTDGSENWYGPAHLAAAVVPVVLRLHQNRPNPFNPRTTFHYSLPHAGQVRLALYDLRGARLATLVDAVLQPGEWDAEWDGKDADGMIVSSGVYVAKLETPGGIQTVKVTVMK
jgi:hypothetical protein